MRPDEPRRAALDTYQAALVKAWNRGIFPFTAAYGRHIEIDPETIHVEPWLEFLTETTPPPSQQHIIDNERNETSLPLGIDEPQRDRAASLVEKHGALGLVILGEPGAGKSTLMRRTAHRALLDGRRLPIFVPASIYAAQLGIGDDPSLPAEAAAYWQDLGVPDLEPLFTEALAEGNALILIDGLDEAGDRRARQAVAAKLAKDMTDWRSPTNLWVFASRPHGYDDAPLPAPAVMRATICPWDRSQIETATQGWCRALTQWRSTGGPPISDTIAQAHAVRLRDQILDDGPLQRLAQNPLSLAMLVLIERQRGKLPDHRVRLYEAYAEELLQRRSITQTSGELDPSEFLIELAVSFHRKHPFGRVHALSLSEECVRIALRYEGYLRAADADANVLKAARHRAELFFTPGMTELAGGILVEVSPDFWSFSHRALQDFFVSRGLARMSSEHRWELLRPRLHAARWREPLLLCAGWLAAVERRREEIDLLCRQVLDARSDEEDLLARDLRLAIEVAANSAGLVRHQRLAELYQRMEVFSSSSANFTVFLWLVDATARLARLGLTDAVNLLNEWIRGGHPEFQRVTLIVLRGKLLGPGGQHLRELAIDRLTSDDEAQRHVAWHDLLPLWNQFETVREALLAAIERGPLPACEALARELTRRALESPPEVRARVTQHIPDVMRHLSSILAEQWSVSEHYRIVILEYLRNASDLSIMLALDLAHLPDDPQLRPEFERLLAHPDPQTRLELLRRLTADLRRGERISDYVQTALQDPNATVRHHAELVAADLRFHLVDGIQRARALLQGTSDERRRVAVNLRTEWWASVDLRPQLLALFEATDPDLAATAFSTGFSWLFIGQDDLVDAALKALASEDDPLRQAALAAMTPHLQTVPAFADAVFTRLKYHTWPDLPHLVAVLQRVVSTRADIRTYLCEVVRDPDASQPLRLAAIVCLGRLSHHDASVWNAIKSIVEQGPTRDQWPVFSRARDVLLRLGEFLPAEGLRRGIVYFDRRRAGLLEETPTGTRFTYDESWLTNPDARPISLTMPLRAQPYESDGLHPYFDNMLPEGWLLERISGAQKIDKRDRLGILLATGSDAIGAVSVIPDPTPEDDE